MLKNFFIEPDVLTILNEILKKNLPAGTLIWVFGSRAKGNVKKFSDLDLIIDRKGQPLSLDMRSNLVMAFDESDIPYKVDIIDWATVSDAFRRNVEGERVLLLEISS